MKDKTPRKPPGRPAEPPLKETPLKEATLKDVAQRAGVSLMTVSNVINKRFGSMSEETRRRVELAIRALNYRPSTSGRSLRLERNFTFGMLVADPSAGFLADPFISQVVAGASGYFGEKGYGCLVHGVRPQEFEQSIFFRFARTDGLCVFLSGTDAMRRAMMQRLRTLPEPIVAVQEPDRSPLSDVCVVRQDDYGGAAALAEHLVERGAERLVFMVPRMTWPAVMRRVRAVRDVLARRGGAARLALVRCGYGGIDEAQAALAAFLDRHGAPSAVIAATERLSVGASTVLAARGLGHLPLAGFRAVDFLRTSRPTVLVVSSAFEIGRRSAELLVERVETGAFSETEVVLPTRIELPVAG